MKNAHMKNTHKFLLKLGTLQSVAMAIYHFFIPYQFGWDQYLKAESPTINWALVSINNYYSFTLLVAGGLLLFFLLGKKDQQQSISLLSFILLVHWLFSFFYQLISPMPLPIRLGFLSYILIGVTVFNSVLFAIPLSQILRKA